MMKIIFFFKFNYIDEYLHWVKNFYHIKLSYTDPCNFLNKCALVSQPTWSMVAVAKDFNILHSLNLSIHFPK